MKKVIVYIIDLLKKIFRPIKKIHKIDHNEEFNFKEIDSLIEISLQQLVEVTNEKKKVLNEDITKMINYYHDITDKVETRRNRLSESSWQTLTILIAVSGLLITWKIPVLFLIPIIIVFSIQIIFTILKLIEYQNQSDFNYPFNSLIYSNKWKWFYKGNPFISNINTNLIRINKTTGSDHLHYLKGLNYFINKYSNDGLDEELIDNIQQLYLLQVHNYYKNKFYLRLNKWDVRANVISFRIISIIFGGYLGYWLYNLF